MEQPIWRILCNCDSSFDSRITEENLQSQPKQLQVEMENNNIMYVQYTYMPKMLRSKLTGGEKNENVVEDSGVELFRWKQVRYRR